MKHVQSTALWLRHNFWGFQFFLLRRHERTQPRFRTGGVAAGADAGAVHPATRPSTRTSRPGRGAGNKRIELLTVWPVSVPTVRWWLKPFNGQKSTGTFLRSQWSVCTLEDSPDRKKSRRALHIIKSLSLKTILSTVCISIWRWDWVVSLGIRLTSAPRSNSRKRL